MLSHGWEMQGGAQTVTLDNLSAIYGFILCVGQGMKPRGALKNKRVSPWCPRNRKWKTNVCTKPFTKDCGAVKLSGPIPRKAVSVPTAQHQCEPSAPGKHSFSLDRLTGETLSTQRQPLQGVSVQCFLGWWYNFVFIHSNVEHLQFEISLAKL